ncbi:hypothetical protein LEP1GSC170_5792 [Leptospira interrogans serovar Bataviae str. HAI135]|nr:hypothetical protein LEP1GSC170_5792 [Leptospira interrogans serovar Bataviae str. HAI135]
MFCCLAFCENFFYDRRLKIENDMCSCFLQKIIADQYFKKL